MKHYKSYTPQTAPDGTSGTLAAINDKIGFLPNVFSVMGNTPPALNAFVALNQNFGETSLSVTEREIIQIAVSVENIGKYCVAGHTSFAKKQNVDDQIINDARTRGNLSQPKLAALHKFARLVVIKKGHLSEEEVAQFLNAGYSQEQILEVILGVCVKMFSNLTDNVLGFPLDDAFIPYTWDPKSADTLRDLAKDAA